MPLRKPPKRLSISSWVVPLISAQKSHPFRDGVALEATVEFVLKVFACVAAVFGFDTGLIACHRAFLSGTFQGECEQLANHHRTGACGKRQDDVTAASYATVSN